MASISIRTRLIVTRDFIALIINSIIVVVGCISIADCMMESFLPLYLIITGLIGLSASTLDLYTTKVMELDESSSDDYVSCTRNMVVLMNLSILGWNIAGSFCVFVNWNNRFREINNNDCFGDPFVCAAVYLIVFWVIYPFGVILSFNFSRQRTDGTDIEYTQSSTTERSFITGYIIYDN